MELPEVQSSSSLETMISSYFDDPKLFPVLDVAIMTALPDIEPARNERPVSSTVDTLVDRDIPVYPGDFRSYQFPAHAHVSCQFPAQAESVSALESLSSKSKDNNSAPPPTEAPPSTERRQRRRTLSRKVSTFFDFLLGGNDASQEQEKPAWAQDHVPIPQVPWEKHFESLTKSPETFHRELPVRRSKSLKRHRRKVTRDSTDDDPAVPAKPPTCYSYSCDHWKGTPGRKTAGSNCPAYELENAEHRAKKDRVRVVRKSQSFSSLFQAKKQKASADFDTFEHFTDPPSLDDKDSLSSLINVPTLGQSNAELSKYSHIRQKSLDASLSEKLKRAPPTRPSRPRSSSLFSLKRKSVLPEPRDASGDVPDVPRIPPQFLESMSLPSATERRVVVVEQAAPRIKSTVIHTSGLYEVSLTTPPTATSAGSEPLEYLLTTDDSPLSQRVGAHATAHLGISGSRHFDMHLSGGPQAV